jgi:hypothetical protein
LSEPASTAPAGPEPDEDAAAEADAQPASESEPATQSDGEPAPASESEPAAQSSAAPGPGPEGGDESGTGSAAAEEEFSLEGLMDALRQAKVRELLLSTVSTLASVAYGKLESADLPEAKLAIDGVGAIVPLLSGEIEPGMLRDLEQALTNLRLAYADAVGSRQ